MNIIKRFQSNRPNTVTLAGWLIADLLLALAMIFFVFNTVGVYSEETATPIAMRETATPTVTMTVTAEPTITTPKPVGVVNIKDTSTPIPTPTPYVSLDLNPSYVTLRIDPAKLLSNSEYNRSQISKALSNAFVDYKNKRAGLVITLGYHPESPNGYSMANRANTILAETYPEVFGGAVMKGFWWLNDPVNPAGTLKFEVYFFIDE